jgi:NADPH-dependent curcumin reductase CurA
VGWPQSDRSRVGLMSSMQLRVVLARRPSGVPRKEDFRIEQAPVDRLAEGEILVANRLLSIDPAIRGFLDDRESYLPPVALGEVVRGMTLGEVIQTRNPDIAVGTHVRALAGWEQFSVLRADALGLETVGISPGIPLEYYMGALGPAGLTAWIGLNEIARIKAGQNLLVSAAAGAVGSVAGQIGRLQGCRVIGLAGSDEKIEQLKSLGYHAAINYRATSDLSSAIRQSCPDGIDVYFDNVGGPILELALPLMRTHGTVVVCGMVSDYNHQDDPYPVRTLWQIVVKRLTIRGFLTYEHAARIPEAQRQLGGWVRSDALRAIDNIHVGIETAPTALIALMSGDTIGKTLVRL